MIKLESDIDEISLKKEVEEIKNLLETLTKKDLKNLEGNVLQKYIPWQSEHKSGNETQHSAEADK